MFSFQRMNHWIHGASYIIENKFRGFVQCTSQLCKLPIRLGWISKLDLIIKILLVGTLLQLRETFHFHQKNLKTD